SHWDSLNSPLIQDEGDGKSLKLRFDVSQYTPEEIVVKTVDNKLLVHAKHEEKSETKSVYREYNREFLLPKGTNPEAIKSSLSRDGVLTVEAPLPQLAITDRNIPIQKH
ncbi:Hsp20 family protein, partial [Microbacterium aurugineum]